MAFLNNPLAGLQADTQASIDLKPNTLEESACLRHPQNVHQWYFTNEESTGWRQGIVVALQANRSDNPIDPKIGSTPALRWQDFSIVFQSSVRITAKANYVAVQLVSKQSPVNEFPQQVRPDAEVDFEYVDVQDQEDLIGIPESTEMKWLVHNSDMLSTYSGEWLLIHGEMLLAHSRDFEVIREEISRRNLTSPFVYYVPLNEESNSVTI